jgi:hypothetical protein
MKANELRIGNYYHYHIIDEFDDPTEYDIVRQTDAEDLDILSNEEDTYYKPIPLTEEWLLKLGFELEDDNGDIKCYEIQRFWYYVIFDHGEVRLDIKTGKNITHTVFYMDERFQYVHQLQNLYFALTGLELTIKE